MFSNLPYLILSKYKGGRHFISLAERIRDGQPPNKYEWRLKLVQDACPAIGPNKIKFQQRGSSAIAQHK